MVYLCSCQDRSSSYSLLTSSESQNQPANPPSTLWRFHASRSMLPCPYTVACFLTSACLAVVSSPSRSSSVMNRATCRKLDQVKVIGSDKVTEMWTCDVPRIKNKAFNSAFKAAVDLYVQGNWPKALQRIEDARAVSAATAAATAAPPVPT